MSIFVADQVSKLMLKKGITVEGANILIMGLSFKENCPDIRNTKVIDVYKELVDFGLDVDLYDPEADSEEVMYEYGVDLIPVISKQYDGILLAVSHNEFATLQLSDLKKDLNTPVFDLKGFLPRNEVNSRL